MSKILRIIFIISAFCIVVDDYFHYAFYQSVEMSCSEKKDGEKDDEKNDKTNEKEDSEEKDDKEDKINNTNEIKYCYEILLNSQYFSAQQKINQIALLYETRCRELESPPPEA